MKANIYYQSQVGLNINLVNTIYYHDVNEQRDVELKPCLLISQRLVRTNLKEDEMIPGKLHLQDAKAAMTHHRSVEILLTREIANELVGHSIESLCAAGECAVLPCRSVREVACIRRDSNSIHIRLAGSGSVGWRQ